MRVIAIDGPGPDAEALLSSLVGALSARGQTVSVAIDDPGLTIDKPAKDTGQHQAAGAVLTLGTSPGRHVTVGPRNEETRLDTLLDRLGPADIVLTVSPDGPDNGNRIVIGGDADPAGNSVVLTRDGSCISTARTSDIDTIASLITADMDGPTT